LNEIFKEATEVGVPEELRDILRSKINGQLSMKDALKIPRIAYRIAAKMDAYEQAQKDKAPNFTSNKPGEERGRARTSNKGRKGSSSSHNNSNNSSSPANRGRRSKGVPSSRHHRVASTGPTR